MENTRNIIKVILNPNSGRGKGAKNENRIRQALTAANISFDLQKTQGMGHATQLARQARIDGHHIVVAAGGDGTISEVVNGLAQATPENECVRTLAILPLGSGNDFASAVGCSSYLHQAVTAITNRRTRRVDLGWLKLRTGDYTQQRYFNNNLGIGLEAKVTEESQKIKFIRGMGLYLLGVFKALRYYTPCHLNLQWQSTTKEIQAISQSMLLISFGNSYRTGGGFSLNRDAKLDDGLLDFCFANNVSKPQILGLLWKVIIGSDINNSIVNKHQCRKAHISSEQTLLMHADGELIVCDEIEIELQPHRLEVIVN